MPKLSSNKSDKLTLEEFRQMFAFFESSILGKIESYMFEQRSDIAGMKDEEEQAMLNDRSAKINKIEDRVEKLEEIHPHNQHATS